MLFGHKNKEHEHAGEPAAVPAAACKLHLVCGLRHDGEADEHVTCRIEEVAVPEVETGMVEPCEVLDEDACTICYETAVPEIHFDSMLHCPAVDREEM